MENSTVFDDPLFAILRDCKTLPNFLDVIFGFLKRRTDFYCIASEPNSPVGLPAGWAEHFVKEAFFKWKLPDKNDRSPEKNVPINSHTQGNTEAVIESCNNKKLEQDESNVGSKPKSAAADFTCSESYNGAMFDNYLWSQTITDVDIIVKLPQNVTSKDLSIVILPQKIKITHKCSNTILLDGDLCHKIKHNDALWSLDKQKLEIHLDKSSEMWWDCLIQSEPRLDVSKIDCSRPFEELSEEAQAKIEELTWNQERKRLGLPTSEQVALQEKLKKAWDAEGSPFKGPCDPNTVIIS